MPNVFLRIILPVLHREASLHFSRLLGNKALLVLDAIENASSPVEEHREQQESSPNPCGTGHLQRAVLCRNLQLSALFSEVNAWL